jgi:SAM-dependent methyltransferase
MKERKSKQERKKYEKVWGFKAYRESGSPGDVFLQRLPVGQWLENHNVRTVLDAGCGAGRMIRSLKRKMPQLDVYGMDIAKNSIDPRLKDVFINQCIWDESPMVYDAVFCIDVLEHLPEDKVEKSIRNLRSWAKKLLLLSICMKTDNFGKALIDEPLHLTVKPARWWLERIMDLGEIEFLMASPTTLDVVIA